MARVWSLSKLSPCHLRLGPRPVKSSGMTALKVGGGRGLACSGSSDENWASRFAWNRHLLLRKAQRTHYEFATTHKACATCENNKRSTCERRRARRVQGTLSAGPPPMRGAGASRPHFARRRDRVRLVKKKKEMLIERAWATPPVMPLCGLATQGAWKWNVWTCSSGVSSPGTLSQNERR